MSYLRETVKKWAKLRRNFEVADRSVNKESTGDTLNLDCCLDLDLDLDCCLDLNLHLDLRLDLNLGINDGTGKGTGRKEGSVQRW